MLGLELLERILARGQRAPCGAEVDRGGVQKAHELMQGWVRRQARGAGLTVTVTGNSGFPVEMDPIGGVHRRSDIALKHDAFNPFPGVRVPFYRELSSASVDADGSAPRPRPDALKHRHAVKMR
jgi:hypothetical protein